MATTPVGAPGTPVVVTLFDLAEAVPVPLALMAATVKVYAEPPVSPVTVSVVAVLLNVCGVWAVVPMNGVTTYPVRAGWVPASAAGAVQLTVA